VNPGGVELLFEREQDGQREIFVGPPGGGQRNLTRHPGRDHLPAWSPDGGRILLSSRRDGGFCAGSSCVFGST
jgi:Tol biopolymer transport system component